jgi:hypothetical protein
MSVLAFAYRVYPFILTVKGGGDYSEVPLLTVQFQTNQYAGLPRGILNTNVPNALVSVPLVLIEETSASLFFADPNDPHQRDGADGGGRDPTLSRHVEITC